METARFAKLFKITQTVTKLLTATHAAVNIAESMTTKENAQGRFFAREQFVE